MREVRSKRLQVAPKLFLRAWTKSCHDAPDCAFVNDLAFIVNCFVVIMLFSDYLHLLDQFMNLLALIG